MTDKSLVALLTDALDRGETDLPVFDAITLKLRKILAKADYSMTDVARTIYTDQGLTSRVLRLANSSFYAGLTPVKTINDASVRLGSDAIVNLVTTITQQQLYQSPLKVFRPIMKQLWNHALGTAVGARWLASRLGFQPIAEEAFMSGLLHDVGKLLLLKNIEKVVKSGTSEKDIPTSLIEVILADLHVPHGKRLMELQNMPTVYCEAVAKHHDPDVSGNSTVLNLVRLANLTCHKIGLGLKQDPGLMLSTSPEAFALMAKDIILAELQVKLESFFNVNGNVEADT